jgi:hypothetical protein
MPGTSPNLRSLLAAAIVLATAAAASSEITTVSYQVAATNDDGYAWGAGDQDIGAAHLMIGDERLYAPPYYMSGMRFTGVAIPRSAAITQANLKISSLEDGFRGQIYGVIQAETADNPGDFAARYMAAAVKTAAAVDWDHKFAWDPSTLQTSGDISAVIQEVINRPGYSSGNAIVLFYSTRAESGKSRMFASFESAPASAAILEITYQTYTISGHILTTEATPLEGVTLSAGADIESDLTDASGYYALKVPLGWSGTVTPDKAEWSFNPPQRSYSNLSADQPNQDYTAFEPVISGYVKDEAGAGVEGVTVSADNGGGADTTDANGYYQLTVGYNWSGVVTPTKPAWGFNPQSRAYSNIVADQTNQDYTGFQPVITGHVTDELGSAVPDVLVLADNGGGSDITDSAGYYELTVPYYWSGAVTCAKAGWGFTPQERIYSDLADNQANQDFTAFQPVISGHIQTEYGFPTAGVLVSADNGGGADTTDANGYYELTVPYQWSGAVTPAKTDWNFNPLQRSYTDVTTDESDQNYTSIHVRYAGGSGTTEDPYLIYTAQHMNTIGANPADWDKHFKLMADIDLADYNGLDGNPAFNLIGRYLSPAFTGVFDGNGHAVSNFTLAPTDANDLSGVVALGMFTHVAGDFPEIRDLTLRNVFVDGRALDMPSAALVGRLRGSPFINACRIEGGEIFGGCSAAGLVAISFAGVIYDCHVSCHVEADSPLNCGPAAGLLVGENDADIYYCTSSGTVVGDRVGGLVGWSGFATIVRCRSDVQVTGIGYASSGGLVGISNADIEDCAATGNVVAARISAGGLVGYNAGTVSGSWASGNVVCQDCSGTGGLVGTNIFWDDYERKSKVLYSFATGDVVGFFDVGGLVGDNEGIISDSYASGNANGSTRVGGLVGGNWNPSMDGVQYDNGKIYRSYSVGRPSADSWVGGLVGATGENTTVSNCFWDTQTSGLSTSAGGTGKTTAEMQTESTFTSAGWDFNTPVWQICEGVCYPSLWWQYEQQVLGVMPTQLQFAALEGRPSPAGQMLSVGNCGTGILNWQIDEDCTWLDVEPNSGSLWDFESIDVNVTVDPCALGPGFYDCQFTVGDPNATSSPRTVTVSLHVRIPGELHVPDEYSSVEAAIYDAQGGETVVLQPGSYDEYINFHGKPITVASTNPYDPNVVAATIIDGAGAGPALTFSEGEGPASILAGFTITNGAKGVYCENSSPTIAHCVITDNAGHGIDCIDSGPTIVDCTISDNAGAGISLYSVEHNTAVVIINCRLLANTLDAVSCENTNLDIINSLIAGNGANGFWAYSSLLLSITNSTIVENAELGFSAEECRTTVANSIIRENGLGQIYEDDGILRLRYCNIEGGWPGIAVIDAEPNFVVPGAWVDVNDPNIIVEPNDPNALWLEGDYHLLAGSACIDVGDNASLGEDVTDLDGDSNTVEPLPLDLDYSPRIIDGDCNATDVVDMGAYEAACACIGDFDADCDVGLSDFAMLASAWLAGQGQPRYNPACDVALPPDGFIDWRDLKVLTEEWLSGK